VEEGHERVVDYVFKTVLRARVSYDEGLLLLPRAREEVVDRTESSGIPRRTFTR
jgi:hypothetical protein